MTYPSIWGENVGVFPLEKILTCSAEIYLTRMGDDVRRYDLVGVHLVQSAAGYPMQAFQVEVPQEAIAVVDFRISDNYASGTALIPRELPAKLRELGEKVHEGLQGIAEGRRRDYTPEEDLP